MACSVLDHSPQRPSESCMIQSGKVRVLPGIHGHGELVLLAEKVFQYNWLFASVLALKYCLSWRMHGDYGSVSKDFWNRTGIFPLAVEVLETFRRESHRMLPHLSPWFAVRSLPLHVLLTQAQSHFGSQFPVLCNRVVNQWIPTVSSTSNMSWFHSRHGSYQRQMALGSSHCASV